MYSGYANASHRYVGTYIAPVVNSSKHILLNRRTEDNAMKSKRLSIICFNILWFTDPGGCVGLLPPVWWDCGFESRGAWMSLVILCCQIEASASGWSLIQRCPIDYGVFGFDLEASTMRRPWPARDCHVIERKKTLELIQSMFAIPTRGSINWYF
jgi:hypothetical protein